jgi:hypothetical protein
MHCNIYYTADVGLVVHVGCVSVPCVADMLVMLLVTHVGKVRNPCSSYVGKGGITALLLAACMLLVCRCVAEGWPSCSWCLLMLLSNRVDVLSC